MTKTLTIALTDTEMKLLLKSSALHCRRPQEQARFLLRSSLFNDSGLAKEILSQNANSDGLILADSVAVAA